MAALLRCGNWWQYTQFLVQASLCADWYPIWLSCRAGLTVDVDVRLESC